MSKWKMPAWMTPDAGLVSDTGGNTVEDLMNRDSKEANIVINAPLALMCASVAAQVTLLEKLHARGDIR